MHVILLPEFRSKFILRIAKIDNDPFFGNAPCISFRESLWNIIHNYLLSSLDEDIFVDRG